MYVKILRDAAANYRLLRWTIFKSNWKIWAGLRKDGQPKATVLCAYIWIRIVHIHVSDKKRKTQTIVLAVIQGEPLTR